MGAGMAGIVAAKTLTNLGVKVDDIMVLEGSDRSALIWLNKY